MKVLVVGANGLTGQRIVSGVLDTGLNAVPFVGAAKNVMELARGRDIFPDRPRTVRRLR